MQVKTEKFTKLELQSYYQGLTQKERVKLKKHVAQKFDLSYYTVDAKFSGKTNISAAELLALQPIIEEESWRQ